MMALALTIGAQAQQDDGMDAMLAAMIAAKVHQDSIDTSSLVAVYDYECQTQDADGKAVTDKMKVCLQVGQHCTRSYPYRKFRKEREWAKGEEFRKLYNEQPFICLKHYHFVMSAATGKGGLSSKLIPDFYAETAALTKNYLMSLKKDITHFCSMFDYRSQGQEWGTSIDAIERSTDFLTGKG